MGYPTDADFEEARRSALPGCDPMTELFNEVRDEVARARRKFPGPAYTYTALVEEVGELARAILHTVSKTEPDPYAAGEVHKEAVQVMAMCVRLLHDGDVSLGLPAFNEAIQRMSSGVSEA